MSRGVGAFEAPKTRTVRTAPSGRKLQKVQRIAVVGDGATIIFVHDRTMQSAPVPTRYGCRIACCEQQCVKRWVKRLTGCLEQVGIRRTSRAGGTIDRHLMRAATQKLLLSFSEQRTRAIRKPQRKRRTTITKVVRFSTVPPL